jgi:hypothetical protein
MAEPMSQLGLDLMCMLPDDVGKSPLIASWSAELQVDLRDLRLRGVDACLQFLDERGIGLGFDDVRVLELDVVDAVHVYIHLREVEQLERPLG